MPAEDQRAAEGPDRPQVVAKVPKFLDGKERSEYRALQKETTALERKPMPYQEFALSVNNCEVRPPAANVLVRGSPHAKGKEVKPGFPAVLDVPDPVVPEPAKGAKT